MEIQAISEDFIFFRPENQSDEDFVPSDILRNITTMKDAGDFVEFVLETPYSFMKLFKSHGFFEDCEEHTEIVPLLEFPRSEGHIPHELLSDLSSIIARHHKDIHYSDNDDYLKRSAFRKMRYCGYEAIWNASLVALFDQVKSLLKNIAIANQGTTVEDALPIYDGEEVIAKIASYGFWVDIREHRLPIQNPPIDELFDEKTIERIVELHATDECEFVPNKYSLRSSDYLKDEENKELGRSKYLMTGLTEVPVYPPDFSSREISANLVTSIMNSVMLNPIYPPTRMGKASLQYGEKGFTLCITDNPMQRLFKEIADVAVKNDVHLCPHCHIVVMHRRRGAHCSNTCKSNANDDRRNQAHNMAFSGITIDEAIEAIGVEYTKSISRWYEEAQAAV